MSRTEKIYYLVFALFSASWSCVAAVYAVFLLDRGLDLFEINVVLATFFLASFLLEVPTGAVADLFGRKISFLASCVVRAAAFGLYYRANSLPVFLVAELIDAVGQTLASGALDAWAVDGIRAEVQHGGDDRFFARSRMLASAALIVGGCIGAYLGQADLAVPWLAGASGFLLTFAVASVTMQRDRPAATPIDRRGGWRGVVAASRAAIGAQIGGGLALVARHRELRAVCLLTFAVAFAQMPFIHYWQPHMLARSGGETWVLGWVWALLSLAALVGSAAAARAAALPRRAWVLALCAAVRSVTVLFAAWSPRFAPALAGVVGQSAAAGATEPLLAAWVNDHAEAAQRATVLSVHAMSFLAGGSLGLLVLGFFARAHGIAAAWTVAAAVFALCAVAFSAMREETRAHRRRSDGLTVDQAA